jgi:CRISPR-associated protein Cas5 subtype I-B
MDAILFNVSGNWGHFKKVDTNNNPLTHDFITKTALIGMIGAVTGIERKAMKDVFPQLSEDLLYSVALNNHVKKESWGFTLRSVKVNIEKSPWQFEFLKAPDFDIVLTLKDERSKDIFNRFADYIENGMAYYNPTLGLANCPADIAFIAKGTISDKQTGDFKTKGFISKRHQIEISENFDFRIGFERIPTYQDNDFWNDPEKYAEVAYCSGGSGFTVKNGEYYEFETKSEASQWYMI